MPYKGKAVCGALNRTRPLIIFSTLVFLISFLGGTLAPVELNTNEEESFPEVKEKEELTFHSIVFNNLKVVLLLISGCITFGTTTFLNLSINGATISIFYSTGVKAGLFRLVFSSIVHGLLEITGFLIASAAGFKIPYEISRYLLGKKEYVLDKQEMKDYIYLSLASVALIITAAWIEANVTVWVVESVN